MRGKYYGNKTKLVKWDFEQDRFLSGLLIMKGDMSVYMHEYGSWRELGVYF